MKKIVILMSAVATLTMVACGGSDEPANTKPQPQPEPAVVYDGAYTPGAQIATIEQDETTETWEWADGLLQSIVAETDESSINEYTFAYNDKKQMTRMSMTIQQMPVRVDYNYTGRHLTSISATSNGTNLLDGTITHNADNLISQVDLELDSTMADYLSSMMSNFMDGDSMPDDMLATATKGAVPSKMAVDKLTVHYDITWQGKNISSYINTTTFQMSLTAAELMSLPGFDTMLSEYAALIEMFVPEGTTVPLSFIMSDTSEFTYDNHPNPLQGLLRGLEPSSLSANNILTEHKRTGASISINLGFLPAMPIPGNDESHGYNYQYNEAGYPTQVSRDGELAITYTYQQ